MFSSFEPKAVNIYTAQLTIRYLPNIGRVYYNITYLWSIQCFLPNILQRFTNSAFVDPSLEGSRTKTFEFGEIQKFSRLAEQAGKSNNK